MIGERQRFPFPSDFALLAAPSVRRNNPRVGRILPAMRILVVAAIALALLLGCATAPKRSGPAVAPRPEAKPVELPPVVVSPYTDAQLVADFEHARGLLMKGKSREAADIFDRLVRLSPDGKVAPPSLYDGGLAHEELGEREAAIAAYETLARRFPANELTTGALIRLARL